VVEEIAGVVKDVPVPREVPPVEVVYQFIIPALVVAPRTIVPVPQREAGVVEFMPGVVFTVAITVVLEEVQPELVALT
jgi:hypothetical protein